MIAYLSIEQNSLTKIDSLQTSTIDPRIDNLLPTVKNQRELDLVSEISQLAPDVVEFQYLDGISALLQGKLWKVWRILQETNIL